MCPAEVRRGRDVLRLNETVWQAPTHWIHVGHDGRVYIYEQRHGEAATAGVGISRETFAKMIEWYFKNQE